MMPRIGPRRGRAKDCDLCYGEYVAKRHEHGNPDCYEFTDEPEVFPATTEEFARQLFDVKHETSSDDDDDGIQALSFFPPGARMGDGMAKGMDDGKGKDDGKGMDDGPPQPTTDDLDHADHDHCEVCDNPFHPRIRP